MLSTIALLVIFAAAPVVFIALYFVTAPYGRHFREGWGPTIEARTSWFLMELPAMVVIAGVVLFDERRAAPIALVLLGLWEMHYIYRTCLFPLLMKDTGKRFPILLTLFAAVFNTLNGYANGHFLAGFAVDPGAGVIPAVRIGLGMALFFAGFVTHVRADSDLRGLRDNGETGYKIPRGGLFEYVASPNYFGEIVEWTGWALATWSLPGLAFALFTAANLVPRAHANRAWYLDTFPDYPRQRKRLIPFVY
jgi:protein-S-isoprenylcysteine O-methyltransferase Ste14